MVKLSIIIPYYKTYELTRNLMKSLIAQKTEDVEIILIDDGCDEVRLNVFESTNVIVLHQENKGVSYTRNKGIEIADGEYIAFVDSDDMVMPNYIDTLLELINSRKEEIIYFNWLDVNTNVVITHPKNPAVWKAIYKKEILPRFEECYKAREDYFFLEELNKKQRTEYFYDKVLYVYNSGIEGSLTWKDKNGEL